eukprot:4252444-Pyramimonas_sp.AAC.1
MAGVPVACATLRTRTAVLSNGSPKPIWLHGVGDLFRRAYDSVVGDGEVVQFSFGMFPSLVIGSPLASVGSLMWSAWL